MPSTGPRGGRGPSLSRAQWDRLPAQRSSTEELKPMAERNMALSVRLLQRATQKALPPRGGGGGGRGRVLATVGCSPRHTRSVTCALCFVVARAPAFVSGSTQGGSADTPSGPRFLFHGGDAACAPCKAPVCDAWTCRARSHGRCRPLCATRLPCPLSLRPAQQTSRDCAHPPQTLPRGLAPGRAPGKRKLEAGFWGQARHTALVPAAKRRTPTTHCAKDFSSRLLNL